MYRRMVYSKSRADDQITILTDEGKLEFTPEGILAASGEYWKSLGTPQQAHDSSAPKPWMNNTRYSDIRQCLSSFRPETLHDELDMTTLRYIQHHTKKSTAPGLDGISYDMLQTLLWSDAIGDDDADGQAADAARENILSLILALINMILQTGVFPDALEKGEIIMIFKKGDPRRLVNYRGITLLSVLYKLVTSVLSHRLLNICESAGAICLSQAGTRRQFTAIHRVATLQNIISHAQRNNKPLYLLMTDLAKAFDRVAFEGFWDAIRCLGLDDILEPILDNLQRNFECCARTFYGRTSFFAITVGCKQGDGLSPLKFNLWFDMLIHYIEEKQLDYKFLIRHLPKDYTQKDIDLLAKRAAEEHCLIIAVLGYQDDCMFISDDHTQIVEMARFFDSFLQTYNMAVNTSKSYQICKIPGLPDALPPPLQMIDVDGTLCQVKTLKSTDPFTYLGIECSLQLNDWSAQHRKAKLKFIDAKNKVLYSKASAKGAVNLCNMDVFLVFTYSMGPVTYPQSFRQKLQASACKTVKSRGHFQSSVPYACYSVPVSQNGLGLPDIHALYNAEKVKFLRNVLRTPDSLCRLTSLECLDAIHHGIKYQKDVLCPSRGKIDARCHLWMMFPSYCKDGHEALFKSGWSICRNQNDRSIQRVSAQEFMSPYLGSAAPRLISLLHNCKLSYMVDLLPSLFESEGPMSSAL
jgi:hypothetical protein